MRRIGFVLAATAVATGAFAQGFLSADRKEALPRFLTDVERRYLQSNPLIVPDVTAPPVGNIECVAEYEPMEGIIVAWEGSASWQVSLRAMIKEITNTAGALVYINCDSNTVKNSATSTLTADGVDMTKIRWLISTTDSIWLRDYGPRYIYQNGVRAIVDHVYNRPRPNDDAFSTAFGNLKKHPRYEIGLVHGGGNFHLDAIDRGYATRLINNENPGLTEAQIKTEWLNFQGLNMTLFDPFPTSVDATQHLDMWMQIVGDNRVMVSDWPLNSGSTQDQICDAAASLMALNGYTVFRVPARLISGVHYTYTNSVMCNNVVCIPTYNRAEFNPVGGWNDQAKATFELACTGKTVKPIDCTSIITAAGAIHCIVMHLPVNSAGVNPVVNATDFVGNPRYTLGQQVAIPWIADDDVGVTSVDIYLLKEGSRVPYLIASNQSHTGNYNWNVSKRYGRGNFRSMIVVRDADGRTASDLSATSFYIGW